jgi:DNA-binding winged helix-turn-helix (wHTH) protein/tetratricopeptide (TPR) repeat protein
LYRFDNFQADEVRGVLLRDEEPVTLTAKTFELLLSLIRHRHETALKEVLLHEVWPETFVEESNLTQHISMLRKALGEAPQDRRYIVTVPGRGYRFVAEVAETSQPSTSVEVDQAAGIPSENAPTQVVMVESAEADQAATARKPPFRRRSYWVIGGIVAMAVLLTCIEFVRRGSRPRVLTGMESVLLADFENTTGEPVFDGALNEGLAVTLGQSPFLELASRERVRDTLRFMGRSPDERVRISFAREVCERLGSEALIAGSIGRIGKAYVISIDALACNDGSELGREQFQAENKEQVLPELGKAGRRLRNRLGESLASIQKFDVPIQQATTPSLEALKAYSLGIDQRARAAEKNSIPFFEHAIELDPDFAMAHAQLGGAFRNLGESERASEYYRRAYSIPRQLSEREKLYLSVRYYETVEGDIEKAIETNEIWTRMYPRDPRPYNSLAAWYQVIGQYEKAADAARSAIHLEPDYYTPYANLATSDLALNRFKEAKETADQADKVRRDSHYTHQVRFDLAFIAHDQSAMQRELEWGSEVERHNDMLASQGRALVATGRLSAGRASLEQSWRHSLANGLNDNAAYSIAQQALAEADFGNLQRARQLAEAALKTGRGIDAEETAAEALAFSGDLRGSERLIEELQKRFPHHTPLNRACLPSTMAALEIHHANPGRAIAILEQAAPYDLSEFSDLSPVYIRGIAYLRAGRGTEAAAQFQTIIEHPGIDPLSPRHLLAYLWLGRAFALAGSKNQARESYDHFLKGCSNADRDVPILKEARREFEALR